MDLRGIIGKLLHPTYGRSAADTMPLNCPGLQLWCKGLLLDL